MTTMVWVYIGYLATCILVTALVAKTLREHGPAIMAGKADASPLTKAKTHLMVVGFYLLALGLTGFVLKIGGTATDATSAIEVLSTKIGGMVLVIGLLHLAMFGTFASAGGAKPKLTDGLPLAERVTRN